MNIMKRIKKIKESAGCAHCLLSLCDILVMSPLSAKLPAQPQDPVAPPPLS